MGKFSGYLLASDFDGTLVPNHIHELPKRNLDAAKYFMDEGGLFTIVTGRHREALAALMAEFGITINAPAGLCHGAQIYDFATGRNIWGAYLDHSVLDIVKKVTREMPEVGIEIYLEDATLAVRINKSVKGHIEDESNGMIPGTLDDVAGRNIIKVLFTADEEILAPIGDLLATEDNGRFTMFFTAANFFDILSPAADKGVSAQIVAELNGIHPSKVIAIGDFYNDIAMLRAAGFSATVAGAPDEVKKIAGRVMCAAEDGAVADLIDYLDREVGKSL